MNNENYLLEVWTTKKYRILPQGTHIRVKSEDENNYLGLCSMRAATFEIKIPKRICSIEDPSKKTIEMMVKKLKTKI